MNKELIIIHKVKCKYCGKVFDRDKLPFKQISNARYAHYECAVAAENAEKQKTLDKDDLEKYIMQLLQIDYITPKIRKQIKSYVDDYHYTYSGIKKALIYFYEIKGNDVGKANEGIGIVSYIYKESYNYFYSLWLAKQKNEGKVIADFRPEVQEVRIVSPKLRSHRRKLFRFFEEDV